MSLMDVVQSVHHLVSTGGSRGNNSVEISTSPPAGSSASTCAPVRSHPGENVV